MTDDQIIRDAGDRIRTGEITSKEQFARHYKIGTDRSHYLYHEARAYGQAYGIDLFPTPNHENTHKEWMR